ncbi:MAG: hypothetical protein K2L11_05425 [Muribaculaceae bacterium]|nr:hypothetical protein [Muribaculaceae bacterium]
MRKSLLTLGVACMALSSYASTRILYQQNFETATSPEETGWSYGGGSISVASDAFGKFLELSLGQNNGRSGVATWGQDIYMYGDESILENGTYSMKFDFAIAKGSNNQYNGCITVFTNHAPVTNQPYRNPWPAGYWQNYLFDMSQVDKESLQYVVDGGTIESVGEDGAKTYAIDYSDPSTFEEGKWYTVELEVDTNSREVEYSVTSLEGDIVKQGTLNVPENDVNGDPISMFAEGLFVMTARYQTIIDIDNLMIYLDTSYDYANIPTIALTRVGQTADETLDLNMRAYTISFLDGETLHVVGPDGQEVTADYAECEGNYVYETSTSGVLQAWTTSGDAKSPVAEATVDCTPIVLPEGVATISAVSAGYGKTYTLSVNNADVPLRPTIFIDYEFTGVSGEKIAAEGQASGCNVTVTEEGTLKITTSAFGYESKTVTVKNDLQFEVKNAWDFARLTPEEISAVGFPEFQVLNSDQTSGFNNWTARKRLNYISTTEKEEKVDEEGNVTEGPATIYPFGFIAEDNTTNVINYSVIDRTGVAETTKGEYFEGLTIFPERGKLAEGNLPNVGMLYRIGLYNDQTNNNNNNVYVNDLDASDFVVVNYINNYGGNSCHPEVATDAEYYAVLAGEDAVLKASDGTLNEETGLYDVAYALYRVDTAITKITVYKQAGGDAVEAVEATVAGDNYYYSIDGIRVAEPTRPGLYIHNGKKIIVK